MKKLFSIVLLLACSITLMAQEMPDNLWQADEPINPYGCEYVANEVIVKFKHSSPVRIQRHKTTRRFVSASVTEVDMVLDSLGIFDVEDLMPLTGHMVSQKVMTVGGKRLAPDQNLSKLCNIVFDTTKIQTVDEAIAILERLPEVEYAEPNYIVRIMSASAEDTIYDHLDAEKYMAEPLYSQQYGPAMINLPWLWNQPKSKKRPVIAIIDTGVDIEHPDLKDNIWCNEAEINGIGGQDDDHNGYFEDIHGYDFVNNTGVIGDRNGHGTHCAGIAAAVGNNDIGITGANPDALIMPVQVLDKSGTGSVSTIIKGIDYAIANGADILSMSFGGNCSSEAEEYALLKAFYAGKYLVAAAGNDGEDIYASHPICVRQHMFPAAYKFVIGVMATDDKGNKAAFSNFDEDGPYYSEYDPTGPAFFGDYYNYDIAAPGSDIMSTFLNGTYRAMSGTSMSTPLVAGALSRLLQCRTFISQESCQGLLIQTRDTNTYNNIDVKAAMEFDEMNVTPVLVVTNFQIVDTINGGNGDGKPNPGETLEIYPTVRCVYGYPKNASIRMKHGLNVDTTTLEFIKRKAFVGYSLSPGASIRSKEPIVVKIAEKCDDGYSISLYSTIYVDSIHTIDMASKYAHQLVLKIEDKHIVKGIIDSTLVLGPDRKHHFMVNVTSSPKGNLIIKPGTTILINDGVTIDLSRGRFTIKGTPDSIIVFTTMDSQPNAQYNIVLQKEDTVEYASFEHNGSVNYHYYRQPTELSHAVIVNSTIRNHRLWTHGLSVYNSNIYHIPLASFSETSWHNCSMKNQLDKVIYMDDSEAACFYILEESFLSIPYNCNILNEPGPGKFAWNKNTNDFGIIKMEEPCYFGTIDMDILQQSVYDATTGHGTCQFDLSNRLIVPSKEAPGIVWKIHVDGEEILPYKLTSTPIGVGTHKFEIYYSCAMDTSIYPIVSFGVREPYTQHVVAEDPLWSADSTIFTAYYTINARTMTDGVNRVLISGGQDDQKFTPIIEKQRFDIIVQATGSLATGLFAEAGLGKVTLQWHTDEEDFEDLMGYHIYRWTEDTIKWDAYWDDLGNYIEAGWKFDTVLINDVLLLPEDTAFIDYDVIPGKSYYYEIRQLNTSFTEYNFSHPVTATPLTAQKGDANGSMSVDVADVVAEVSYLTGGNPQPFIFEAADVNSDTKINILDIVATVSIITNPAVSSLGFAADQTASYSIEDGILYIETPVVLGGVQFAFNLDAEVSALEALNGFEQMTWNTATNHNFMAYSMSGKVLEVGKHALLYVGDAALDKIVLSNAQGQNVPAIQKTATGLSSVESMQMRLPNPNPFTTQVTIPYIVGQIGEHHVQLVFTNLAGMVVDSYATTNTFGEYTYTWRPSALPEGVYFVTLLVDGKKMQSNKLIRVK